MACKDKHDLGVGLIWRRVYEISGGDWEKRGGAWIPHVFAYNLSIACNHCAKPVCKDVCPTAAITKRKDGIVMIDREKCMGFRRNRRSLFMEFLSLSVWPKSQDGICFMFLFIGSDFDPLCQDALHKLSLPIQVTACNSRCELVLLFQEIFIIFSCIEIFEPGILSHGDMLNFTAFK